MSRRIERHVKEMAREAWGMAGALAPDDADRMRAYWKAIEVELLIIARAAGKRTNAKASKEFESIFVRECEKAGLEP